jgi:hypothetical protein
MGLSKVSALAKHNLGLALVRRGRIEEARVVELESLRAFEAQGDRRLAGASHLYLAWIFTMGGDVRVALATFAWVLLQAKRDAEALKEARAGNDLLEALGAVEDAEAMIRLVYAEALFACGKKDDARAAITRAKDRLVARAEKIKDAELRRSFVEDEPDHARTIALAAEWGPERQ